jgi:hypothetical protein
MLILSILLGFSLIGILVLALKLRRARQLIPVAIEELRGLHENRVAAGRSLSAGLTTEVEELRRKCNEYFLTIDSACTQRDFWRGWYYRQASEHSSAQSYLLRCVEELLSQYRKETGKAPQLDSVAKSLVEMFKDTHPGLADAGQDAAQANPHVLPPKVSLDAGTQTNG